MIFDIISIGINVVLIVALIFIIYSYLLPPFLGAPFVPTSRKTLDTMIAIAQIKPGECAVDVGSGDGRIVIALAKAGAKAHGYEINPFLILQSRVAIRRLGLLRSARVHWRSFNAIDFSKFNVVTIYGLPEIMKKLEKRMQSELPKGSRVVSHAFQFPNWHCEQKIGKPEGCGGMVYLYRK